jgi:CheY-like chemotaxis protein
MTIDAPASDNRGPMKVPHAAPVLSPAATPSTPRLMVVDDERGVLALIERFAVDFGFEVMTCRGGAGALAQVPQFRPDVVLVDLQMPEIGGLDVLYAIREADPERFYRRLDGFGLN